MAMKDVLVTDYVHPELLSGLSKMGFTYTYAPEMSREEMAIHLVHYKGVVINTRCAIDSQVINTAPDLRWIARLGSGLDIIDLEAAAQKNINVISAPEGNAQAVAEHAMAMLLCLSNNLLSADREVRDGFWMREQNRGWEIAGKTIGIIGYGNNGSAFGRLWKGWDVRVLAYDKYLDQYGGDHVTSVDQDTLLRESDIVSLHIPLTKETHGLVNDEFISKCKTGCVIINTSRGKITELDALLNGLKSGQLKGACLDVLPFEPPGKGDEDFMKIFDELKAMPNVVLSPHIAGWTIESKEKIAQILVDKIKVVNGI